MVWALRRLVVAPAVVALTVVLWVTLPIWLLGAAALSPVLPGRWRAPLVLRLDSSVSAEDVRAVMTAVGKHHDALRMRVANRAGMWEQEISEPGDFADLA